MGTAICERHQVDYLALENCKGAELYEILEKTGELQEDVARYYFKQLLYAVSFCHEKSIAHRDLKPENIMIDSEYNLKLVDFGVSTIFTERDKFKNIVGT